VVAVSAVVAEGSEGSAEAVQAVVGPAVDGKK
jgi:hypothetical protein